MIFYAAFFISNLFSMNNFDFTLSAKTTSIIITQDNILNLESEIKTFKKANKPHASIPIAIQGVSNNKNTSYKTQVKTLKNLLSIKSKDQKAYLDPLHETIRLYKSECINKITLQSHLITFASSFVILLFKKYCHKNIGFFLAASLTVNYCRDYEYFKEKYKGKFQNAIPDFGVFAFFAFVLFGIDRILAYL